MINFHNIDCMQFMKSVPDKHYELAIVDPPYMDRWAGKFAAGSDVSTTGVKRDTRGSKHWNVPKEAYFKELYRVSEHQIIWGCQYYARFIPHVGRIIWDKKNDDSTFSKAELAASDLLYGVQMFRYLWNGMIQQDMKHKEKRIHPTQKPAALYRWILQNYAKQGDKILDTHVGSASSLIACHDLGFDADGCELDPDYYRDALARLNRHRAQMQMFNGDLDL